MRFYLHIAIVILSKIKACLFNLVKNFKGNVAVEGGNGIFFFYHQREKKTTRLGSKQMYTEKQLSYIKLDEILRKLLLVHFTLLDRNTVISQLYFAEIF